ncbi:hypothetical protein M3194_18530 [Paenibacillus glycanilyticus]|uniref:hypothetical protein n=1 Tax=Paenibacillus glycanilyticus TaxID=126569 RepID=UPI00203BE67D|nr:hypothetical protein [Paenibacillus glycanilyticus]MCM3629344.1 hypothetical protein [Paenibacillus glycanilyticus]
MSSLKLLLRNGKYRFLLKEALKGEIVYLLIMSIFRILFGRPYDWYDLVAGMVFGVIFGHSRWKTEQQKNNQIDS